MDDLFNINKRNIILPKPISHSDIYNINETALPLFEQFIQTKPCCSKFGEDGIIMLRDAMESYLKYSFDTIITSNLDIQDLIDQCVKYARIYYRAADVDTRSGVMQLLRSRIGDTLRQYKKGNVNSSSSLESIVDNFYRGVKEIIEAGDN